MTEIVSTRLPPLERAQRYREFARDTLRLPVLLGITDPDNYDSIHLLQKLGLALFPLHPALFWLDRRLCRERELACDDGVLRATQARKAYAACLARLTSAGETRLLGGGTSGTTPEWRESSRCSQKLSSSHERKTFRLCDVVGSCE